MAVRGDEVAKMTLSSIINDAPAWVECTECTECTEEDERGMAIAQMV